MASKKKIKMYGTGNFQIEETLYVFRDGSTVEAKNAEHAKILEAEAKRRSGVDARLNALEEARKEEIAKIK